MVRGSHRWNCFRINAGSGPSGTAFRSMRLLIKSHTHARMQPPQWMDQCYLTLLSSNSSETIYRTKPGVKMDYYSSRDPPSLLPIFPLIRPICFPPLSGETPDFRCPSLFSATPCACSCSGSWTFKEGGHPCSPSILPVSPLDWHFTRDFYLVCHANFK